MNQPSSGAFRQSEKTGVERPSKRMTGDSAYTKSLLSVYDGAVLGFSLRWIWGCPSRHLLDLYNRHVGAAHLDIGVGTGYFLDKCRFPSPEPRIVLLDLNTNCLERTARRLQRYGPRQCKADILGPFPELGQFDSIGMSLILQCLAGGMAAKMQIFGRLERSLKKGGTFFGATILNDRSWTTPLAVPVAKFYNYAGAFSNLDDDQSALEAGLAQYFPSYQVSRRGRMALFAGRKA